MRSHPDRGPVLVGRGAVGACRLRDGAVAAWARWRPASSTTGCTDLIQSQLIGLDAVSLALVGPLAALAGVLTLRGHALGPVLALGPTAYVAYMVPQYVLGPDYLNLAGNNERFFPLLLTLFVLGTCGAIAAWAAIDLSRLPESNARERLIGRVLLPIAAVLVFGRYPLGLANWMSATPDRQRLPGRTELRLDDRPVGPRARAAGQRGRLHRRTPRGAMGHRNGLYAIVAWYALVGTAVAAGTWRPRCSSVTTRRCPQPRWPS